MENSMNTKVLKLIQSALEKEIISSVEVMKILEDHIKYDLGQSNKSKPAKKMNHTKINKSSNYLDIIHIGLKLETQTGRPFEITNVYDDLIIKNSKGKEYKMDEEILKDYILKKDFNNSRRHYSYEPSIAKYISEQLNEN